MYKHTSHNCYPEISLHDTIAYNICYESHDLIFRTRGFTLCKDLPENPSTELLYTDDSELRLRNTDPWGIVVRKLDSFRIAKGIVLRKWKYLPNETFIENVNSGKWRFEFVDEYYSSNKYYGFRRAIFIGNIIAGEQPHYKYSNTQIEVREYEESQYSWNSTFKDDPPW